MSQHLLLLAWQAMHRRFDEARQHGEHVVAPFGSRLRDEVELATPSTEIRRVANLTVRPASSAVWLRDVPTRQRLVIS